MVAAAKYQVFISSTFEDLKDERDQVIRAVLEMGHIPVGMEMFSAADEEQWKIIARHIDESDYYAVIVAHRLGSLTDKGISYTRKEYEYAATKGIPTLGFVIDEKASWPADWVDKSSGTKKALTEFKTRIREKPVSFWSSAEDLYGRFSVALMKAITAQPREGWVRASSVGSAPEVTAEVIRLSAENASLRNKLVEAKAASEKDQRDEIQRTIDTLFSINRQPAYRYAGSAEWQVDADFSLFMIFRWLSQDMIVESSIEDLSKSLAMHVRGDTEKAWDIVAYNQLKGLLLDLMTLELVQPSTRKHHVSDTTEYWSLSSYGKEVFNDILKVLLSSDRADQGAPEDEPEGGQDGSRDEEDSDTAKVKAKADTDH